MPYQGDALRYNLADPLGPSLAWDMGIICTMHRLGVGIVFLQRIGLKGQKIRAKGNALEPDHQSISSPDWATEESAMQCHLSAKLFDGICIQQLGQKGSWFPSSGLQ